MRRDVDELLQLLVRQLESGVGFGEFIGHAIELQRQIGNEVVERCAALIRIDEHEPTPGRRRNVRQREFGGDDLRKIPLRR